MTNSYRIKLEFNQKKNNTQAEVGKKLRFNNEFA